MRTYRVDCYFGRGLQICIVTDASPWGLGGYLTIGTSVIAYFADALTMEDEECLQIQMGQSASQQVAEALAVLVALRLWKSYWKRPGVCLRIRGDNVGVLTLLMKMRPSIKSVGMVMVARELSLEFGTASYKPRYFEHIPGLSNDWADALSRLHQPDKKCELPERLHAARRDKPPPRTSTYYLTNATAAQSSTVGSQPDCGQ